MYKYDSKRHTAANLAVMDTWIISIKESLLDFVAKEMKAYRLYTVVPQLTKFIDLLTNWYVRMNRRRIKGEFGVENTLNSIDTLFDVLLNTVRMMAPFTPFLTEMMYQRLRHLDANSPVGSVHYQMMPSTNRARINLDIERAVSRMQAVIELGRVMRDRRTMPIKYPLPELIVIHPSEEYLSDIRSLETFILSEMNVRKITLSNDKEKYGVKLRVEPDYRALGAKLKGDLKKVQAELKALTDPEIQKHVSKGEFVISGHHLDLTEVKVVYQLGDSGANDRYETNSDNDVLTLLDCTPSQELIDEGLAREIINRIQKLKKKGKLFPTDPVVVFFSVDKKDSEVQRIAEQYQDFVEGAIKSQFLPFTPEAAAKTVLIEETQELKGVCLKIKVCSTKERLNPNSKWFNIQLQGIQPRLGAKSGEASLCLFDFQNNQITLDQLKAQVEALFGLKMTQYVLTVDGKTELQSTKGLEGRTVIVARDLTSAKKADDTSSAPFAKFVNIEAAGKKLTVFIENPISSNELTNEHLNQLLQTNLPKVDVSKAIITYC